MIGDVKDTVVDWGNASNYNQLTIKMPITKAKDTVTRLVSIPDTLWDLLAGTDRVVFERESNRSLGLIFYR